MIDYKRWQISAIQAGHLWEATKGHTTLSGETLGHVKALIDRIEAGRAAS
jgi:hypothetical protein